MTNVISRPPPTPTTITGSTAETVLAQHSLPANLLTSGKAARMDLAGAITPNATSPTVTIRTRLSTGSTSLGTSVMATTAIACSSGSTAAPFTMLLRLQASSSAVQEHWTDIAIGGAGQEAGNYVGLGSSTKSFNQPLYWQVTAQLSSTSTGLAVDLVAGTVELVR